ncbi:predicted protein [Naegleria gruberi]|uniref:Predicted protein n=1 Tax=Naegleria gruberi TaxID=5762 RepID=D2VSB5_NAEGR|nr:uncharacterized protein NAEGRDRAFT_71880 [Naegleria gruberi]EFC40315.1 predicted protein [Naegleria gruberi]|eukprot:XP_002673059.1 predicted protein [Naegleria gruberi strain NEG-M]
MILAFAVDRKLSDCSAIQSHVEFVANFQSLSKKINDLKEMAECFNEFWWNLFKSFSFATENYSNGKELEQLKILGSERVGKSSITIFFVTNFVIDDHESSFEDTYVKQLKIDRLSVKLAILDTIESDYHYLRETHILYADGFVLICSVDNIKSLVGIREQVAKIVRVKDLEVNSTPIVFVINKIDLLQNDNRKQTIDEFKKEINNIIKEYDLVNTSTMLSSVKSEPEKITLIFEELVKRQILQGDNIEILKNVVEKDWSYIQECNNTLNKKKCSLM